MVIERIRPSRVAAKNIAVQFFQMCIRDSICSIKESTAFTTLAVLNIAGDEEADIKSYMGSVRDFYMNKDSIFLTFDNYEYDEKTGTGREYTDIIALDVDVKKVTYRADGTGGGSLLNQFSMDEYGGYLRVDVYKRQGSNAVSYIV